MKKAIVIAFLFVAVSVFGQEIDRSQYEETTLSDLEVWWKGGYESYSKRFKVTVFCSGTTVLTFPRMTFYDLDGETSEMMYATRRWPAMKYKQRVTIYFYAIICTAGYGMCAIIEDIDYD